MSYVGKTVSLNSAVFAQVEVIAGREGNSISTVINRILGEYFHIEVTPGRPRRKPNLTVSEAQALQALVEEENRKSYARAMAKVQEKERTSKKAREERDEANKQDDTDGTNRFHQGSEDTPGSDSEA